MAPKFNALVLRMNTPEAMLSITKESLTPQAGTMARWRCIKTSIEPEHSVECSWRAGGGPDGTRTRRCVAVMTPKPLLTPDLSLLHHPPLRRRDGIHLPCFHGISATLWKALPSGGKASGNIVVQSGQPFTPYMV